MDKLNVAVFFGGKSSEYSVSLESAYSVIKNMNREKYNPVAVGISEKGDWFYFQGDAEQIKEDTWLNDKDALPAMLSPRWSERRLLVFGKDGISFIPVDAAFPVLHGKNGEDGTIQGLIELAGIPLVGCGVLASSLCMDKDRAHKLVGLEGVRVPKAHVFRQRQAGEVSAYAKELGYPLYVKPVKAGSSYGVTRVQKPEELEAAIWLAFQHDNEIIVEENIEGFEVGCAVLGNVDLLVGEVDEIELSGGFFDFTEKYTLKTSAIYVPARIDGEKAREIKNTAQMIYKALGCRGFARVDMFLTPDGEVVFNEVNTIPGFTEHSRYPGMMKAAGYTFQEVLDKILALAL